MTEIKPIAEGLQEAKELVQQINKPRLPRPGDVYDHADGERRFVTRGLRGDQMCYSAVPRSDGRHNIKVNIYKWLAWAADAELVLEGKDG